MVDLTINALFKRNPQSTEINRFLIRNKLDYFGQTKNTATLKDISTFYKELSEALVIVEDKHISEVRTTPQAAANTIGGDKSKGDNRFLKVGGGDGAGQVMWKHSL